MEVVTRVSGPEPGYIACAVFIVQASETVTAVDSLSTISCACPRLPIGSMRSRRWGLAHAGAQPLLACSSLAPPCCAQAAITLLEDKGKLPAPGVGARHWAWACRGSCRESHGRGIST